jgi:hypothetical protein
VGARGGGISSRKVRRSRATATITMLSGTGTIR